MLRRTAGVGEGDGRAPSGALDDAALWSGARAGERLAQGVERARRARVAATRWRGSGRGIRGRRRAGQPGRTRSEGLAPGAARVAEMFEAAPAWWRSTPTSRARAGEPQGRALLLLSEEIRANVVRGAEAAGELGRTVDEIAAESAEVRRQIERSRVEVSEVGREAAQLQAAAASAAKSLDDLGARLRRATGIDPEMARVVALAAEHARGLMTALSALSTAAQAGPVLGALHAP